MHVERAEDQLGRFSQRLKEIAECAKTIFQRPCCWSQ